MVHTIPANIGIPVTRPIEAPVTMAPKSCRAQRANKPITTTRCTARLTGRAALTLSDEQRSMLNELVGSCTASQREVERVSVLRA